MSLYQRIGRIVSNSSKKHLFFKHGFNWSPMYRRSTGRITEVSKDLMQVKMKLAISYKNKNYVNSIFGGSMFSAVDPIPMVQLINILGDDYVVWDKSAQIKFKRPAREDLFASFEYTPEAVEKIKAQVSEQNEIEINNKTLLCNRAGKVFCEIEKVIYVANKEFYRHKKRPEK